MKTKKRFPKSVIFLLILGALAAGGVWMWNNSLFGKTLPSMGDLVGSTPLAPTQTEAAAALPGGEAKPTAGVPVCGGPAQMIVMVLGIDENEQSDAIRLARIDFVEQKITVLSIPRDFYVPIPGFTEYGITQNRINAAYGFGEYFKVEGGGAAATARTIYGNFGVVPAHYVVFHFDQFAKVIDKIGGVDIVLDKAVFDVGGNPYYGKGKHHFNGETAMTFVRIRRTDTDIQRIDRQTLVLKEVLKKMKDTMDAAQLVGFGIDVVKDKTILTDVIFKDMYTLVCLGRLLEPEDIVFTSIPSEMYTPFTTELGANVRIPGPNVTPFIQDVMSGKIDQ